MICSDMRSGATPVSASIRASILTCSPPRTVSRVRGTRPSMRTAPASIQACRRAREYCGKAFASAWSRRSPV